MIAGSYSAPRAAALSGVPLSTVHHWARTGLVEPSLSPVKVKLWSFADLMILRTICWLRKSKTGDGGVDIPPTSMPAVKRAIGALRNLNLSVWAENAGPRILVTIDGKVAIKAQDEIRRPSGQRILDDVIDILEPFSCGPANGPDLRRPRPDLRIVPGKLSGAPHLVHTRLATETIAALARNGLDVVTIKSLYPFAEEGGIRQALDLEAELAKHLNHAA